MKSNVIYILLTLSLLLSLPSDPALAQQNPQYAGLDILFLVDQSGSMGGADFGYAERAANDPLNLRFEAVQYALDTLGELRLNLASDIDMRMAVINFGDNPIVTLDWTSIAPDTNASAWDLVRQQLLDQLSADTFLNNNTPAHLGNTNFLAAFESAADLFAAAGPDSGQRLKLIILLTDGQPCVVSGSDSFDCESMVAQQSHMDVVLAQTTTDFSGSDYLLYVLALDATGSLWESRQQDWEQIVGLPERAIRVESSEQIGALFLNIITDALASVRGEITTLAELQPGENVVSVPPYHSQLRVSIFKSSTSPGVLTAFSPDGSPLETTNSQVSITNQDRPIEIWTISNPQPGDWRFVVGSEGDRVSAYLQLIPFNAQVSVEPVDYVLLDTITLTVNINSADGALLPIYEAPYTLTAEAQVTLPDGSSQSLPLFELINGVYEGQMVATQPGQYSVGVQAESQYPPGTPYPVFTADEVGTFTVRGVGLTLDSPPENEYLAGNTLIANASLLDDDGQPLQMQGLEVEIMLQNEEGAHSVAVLTDDDGDGMYPIAVTLDEPGTYQLIVRATAETGADAASEVLDEVTTRSFVVLPSQLVQLVLVEPTNDIEQYTTEGPLEGFAPVPLDITFETRLSADGTPLDLHSIVSGETALFEIVVARDGEPLPLTPQPLDTGSTGRHQITLPDLSQPGRYQISIRITAPLSGRYVVDPQVSGQVLTVTRLINPLVYATGAAATLLLLAMLAFVVRRVRLGYQRRQHPARGTVYIEQHTPNEDPKIIWERRLDDYNSNTIVIPAKEIGLSKPYLFKQMCFECRDDNMHRRHRILVTVQGGRSGGYETHEAQLGPGGTVLLRADSMLDDRDAPVFHIRMREGLLSDDYGSGGSLFEA